MEENLDRMLEKLDCILKLTWDVNSTLKRIESRDKSRHMNSGHSDDVRDPRVVEKVHVPSKTTSIIEDISVDSATLILDGHFYEVLVKQ